MTGLVDAVAPIFAIVFVMAIPIVAILTSHQRKMAEMMREDNNRVQQPTPEVDMLRRDVDVLKNQVNQQTILLDGIATQQREILARLGENPKVEERLQSSL